MNYLIQKAIGILGGKTYGLDGAICTCPCHHDKTPSLKLWIKPDGRIGNFCFAGCDFESIDALLVSAGIQEPFKPGYTESAWDKRERAGMQAEAQAMRAEEQAKKDLAGTNKALGIWSETIPLKGTLGDQYLAGRSIKRHSLDVRFHPGLMCGKTGKVHPAIVVLLRDGIIGKGQAIQKIYLVEDALGLITVIKPKITVGPMAGAAVQLAPAPIALTLAEGPETAMSYWQITGTPTWATCGTANLSKVHIPPSVTRLIIAGDNDDKGREAAHKAAAIYAEQGFAVEVHLPPTEGHDWNNYLIARGSGQ